MKAKVALFLLFILISTQFVTLGIVKDAKALVPSQQDAVITGDLNISSAGVSTYCTGLWGLDYAELYSLTDGRMNYDGFASIIEDYFIPQNIRFVLLWESAWLDHANTTTQNISNYAWIDSWLEACDVYGISNVFYFRQWSSTWKEPSWDWDVYQQFPDMQTFGKAGEAINPNNAKDIIPGTKKSGGWYAPDDPRFIYQLKEDLKQLWEYYGEHPSWIGIGVMYGDYATYGARDTGTRYVGFGNFTIRNFADSIFFLRDVDENGYHLKDGTKCKIWEMFIENQSPIKLESGEWQDSGPLDVYGGTSTGGRVVALKFQAPENLNGFRIVWWGKKTGSPPNPLVIELYQNDGAYEDISPYGNDKPKGLGSPIESVNVLTVTQTAEWQTPVQFTSRLAKGSYYWLVFQTSGGENSNKYQIYQRDYKCDESTTRYVTNGYSSYWFCGGGAILRIQDVAGKDLEIYPYQAISLSSNSGGAIEQFFTPQKTVTVNTIMLHMSDRFNDDYGYSLVRITSLDNTVLATGTLTQALMGGLWWWISIPLDTRITLTGGVQYKIRIEKAVGYTWQFQTLETNPVSEGFGGSTDYLQSIPNRDLIFKLADFGDTVFENYFHMTEILAYGNEVGKPGVTSTNWLAIRFNPSYNGPFTSFAFKIADKDGSPSGLTVSLYAGTANQSTGSALESFTVSPGVGWTNITGWSYSMTAGNYYWIVQKAAGSGGYRPARVPNPYLYRWVWSDDSGVTWKPSQQEGDVGDFILRATTANEVFASEPDRREVGTGILLSDTKWTAQSFYVPETVQIKGFMVSLDRTGDNGSPIILEVRSDSGSDTPSDIVLMTGKLDYSKITHQALYYVDLEFPITLVAYTKYWIVFKSVENSGAGVPVYGFKVPNESYGGTAYHTKRSTDGGSSWSLFNGFEGDIIFAPVKTVTPLKVYNTSELSSEIDSYHAHAWTDEPLIGWNSYLNYKTSEILYETAEWFTGYTGRKMINFDVSTIRILEHGNEQEYNYLISYGSVGPLSQIPPPEFFQYDTMSKISGQHAALRGSCISNYPWSSWGHMQDNLGWITPEQIKQYYLMTYPLLAPAVHIFDVSSATTPNHGLDNLTQQQWSRFFGEILSRMRYNGGYFGTEKGAVNVLLIGDQDVGIVQQFLTPALNITMLGFIDISGDYNLTRFGNFDQFDAIVFWAGRPGMSQITPNAQQRIKNFVNAGGGIVSVGAWASWANEMFGDGAGGHSSVLPSDHIVWKPYGEEDFIDSRPHICERAYGSGRGIHIAAKKTIGKIGTDPEIYGAPRDSWLVLLTNAIFYSAKKESVIPAWWYPQYKDFQAWSKQLYYSINGKPGTPILLWLSNNGTTTDFEIHLNSTFYGIDPTGWLAIDVVSWAVVASGSGTDIKIVTTIPAKSWKPIYIMNATSDLQALYSNIFVESQSISPGEAHYTLQGPYKQTSWLLVRSTNQPTGVSVNNTGTLPKHPLDDLLSDSTPNGWYYDSTNKILYVKFHPTSAVEVTAFVSTEQLPSLFVDVTLNPSTVGSEDEVSVYVHVTDQTGTLHNAYVQLTSNNDGNFSSSSGNTDSNGDFSSTFSAPNVSQETSVRITAIVSKSGYVDGVDYKYLRVLPQGTPSLHITISADASRIRSNKTSTVTVHVTDGVNPVSGVAISLLSDVGETFAAQDGITDSNGNFFTIFTAPSVSQQTTCILTANATKSGYYDGYGELQITLVPASEAEIPWVLYLAAILIVVSVSLLVVVKRKSKRRFYH